MQWFVICKKLQVQWSRRLLRNIKRRSLLRDWHCPMQLLESFYVLGPNLAELAGSWAELVGSWAELAGSWAELAKS